jgi:hypothetical protein|nr:MAG TPA: hypothetical protein [Caudoviricetes sp.]
MKIKKLSNGNYEIDEKTLKGLLISRYELDALECGGVDNWQDYCDVLNDYLEDYEDFGEFVESVLEDIKIGKYDE